MKKIYLSLGIIATLGLGLFQTSCKKSPLDNLEVAVNTDVFPAPTAILFENAKAGATNQPANFTLTISGKDKDKVLSAIGTQSFKVQNGYLFLNLTKDAQPTAQNPIIFQISGTAPGFEPFSKDIIITSSDEQKFNVKMIEIGNLPDGLVEAKDTTKLVNGAFKTDKFIETASDANTPNNSRILIQAGTTMKDRDGNDITGSSLDLSVRYFDPKTEAVDVFPGGLNPQNVVDENNKQIEGGVNFISTGLMQIEMRSGDKIVKNFSKPVSAEMELRDGQSNPLTGEALKVGDKIPLWSRDDVSGQWKAEGNATVAEVNGVLVAQFEMSHLSSWNLDFYYGNLSSNPLNIVFDTDWNSLSGSYYITMYSASNDYISASYQGSVKNGTVNTMEKTPDVKNVYLVITDYETNKSIKTETFNPTTKGTIHVDVSSFNEVDLVNISLKYTVKCTKNKIKPNAGTFITITDLVTNRKKIIRTPSIKNATTTDNLEMRLRNNRRYRIETIGLDGKVISYESVLNISNLTYDKLNGFTVNKLIYNTTTKTVEADVTYTTTKC